MAQGFWALLIPHGLAGGALAHVSASASASTSASASASDGDDDDDDDDEMADDRDGAAGWREEYTGWWFEFLESKGSKGVSKDTWQMVSPLSLRARRSPFRALDPCAVGRTRADGSLTCSLFFGVSSSSSCVRSTPSSSGTTRKVRFASSLSFPARPDLERTRARSVRSSSGVGWF